MVLNAAKCYFMRLGNNTKNETFLFNNDFMKNCNENFFIWTYSFILQEITSKEFHDSLIHII